MITDPKNQSLRSYPSFVPTPEPVAELERLGDQIAELSAHLDAATARLLELIREFDERDGWSNGFQSCAEWLTWRIGLDPGAARERVRVARALGTLPRLAEALARGELSYSKVRALTRVATPETEERLLAVGRAGTAKHVELIVRGWRQVDRKAEALETTRRHQGRWLRAYPDTDGMVVIRGRLEPEVGAVVLKALAAARDELYRQPSSRGRRHTKDVPPETRADGLPTWEQLQADALADGTHVSAETSQRLACDATRVVMHHDADGRITEVSAGTRTISPALRRALEHRDRGCRFPGCERRFTQGHHIQHWAQGGPTTLSNLTLLCHRHHRAVHEEGFSVERRSDGELTFLWPNGRIIPSKPGWSGERLDVGYAIEVLHPRALRSSIDSR